MKKKGIAIVLAAVLILALAACGGGGEKEAVAKTDTDTVAIGAIVLARDDVPTDEIYTFVSTIFDNIPAITEQHAKGGELSLEFGSSVTSVPYHPGAAKYFEEKGYPVAAVKDGAGVGEAKELMFGTGGEAGTYYAFGGVLASYVSNNTDVQVTAAGSTGSKTNIEDLMAGTCSSASRSPTL